ncbi:nucleotide-diphospho-sugar transferase [Marasmius fiardii PR-910]|nr:nucleotide-diphospho-sugar transferase [Marasmius fiardii PR-910]
MPRPTPCLIITIVLVLFTLLFFHQSRSSFHPKDYLYPGPTHKNAAIYILVPPSRLHQATIALRSTENSFNRRLKYPYVLLMTEEELTEVTEEMRGKIDWITEGRATFAALRNEDWHVPETLDKSRIEKSLQTIGFSSNYRSMCRFNSGLFYRHPALSKYDWLWRLDTDIEFHCDVPYDPIQRMIDAKALYGFVQISGDADYVQLSLATNVSHFLATHSHIIPRDANLGFVWHSSQSIEKALSGHGTNDDWNKMCMYNNFELSHRSVWESEVYARFFDFLDEAGGFFYERWGDAPIHSFGVSMALRKDQVLQFNDMGYQHQGWPYECPESSARCTCRKEGAAANFRDGSER